VKYSNLWSSVLSSTKLVGVQTPTSPRRRGRPPGNEGAELLAVAREQFISHGFRKTTMDAIAARARISKQSLYGAYPSKDALYAAVVRDWVDQGYDALRPHTLALLDAPSTRDGLRRLADVLQAGILSPPVLQMRTLVAAEADTFPDVAADYVTRSWDRNTDLLAETLSALSRRGALAIDHARVAAEQFVWMVIGAPLNRLTLHRTARGHTARQLHHIADQAVTTFLSRYGPDAPRSGRSAP
jgi:TetR/AcrR family transcriptional regulator, mexJK operon transcriptional repressor